MFSKSTFRRQNKPKQSNWLENGDQKKESAFIPPIQTKLNIGKPGDAYELEADKTADEVVNKTSSQPDIQKMGEEKEELQAKGLASNITPFIQKQEEPKEEESVQTKEEEEPIQTKEEEEIQTKAEEEEPVQAKEEEEEAVQTMKEEEEHVQAKEEEKRVQKKGDSVPKSSNNIESKLSTHRGGGHIMDASTKSAMENSFGNDFSNVRIHTGGYAQEMNRDLSARAFANGNDIYFNSGQYNPGSKDGKHLLAHELTHTIQQSGKVQKKESRQNISSTTHNVQGGFFGDVIDGVKSVGSAVVDAVTSGVNAIGGALGDAWNTAARFVGRNATWVLDGLKTLGAPTLNWLANAGSYVWNAIKWIGAKAWEGLKWLGGELWEKLTILGTNAWSFISNLPFRFWRLLVHGWEGITGVLGWIWRGLSGGGEHIWKAVTGVFNWLDRGIDGALSWLRNGIIGGAAWAVDFILNPSLSKLLNGLANSINWISKGVKKMIRWGWEGLKGIIIWAYEGASGFAQWLWDGFIGGISWIGTLIMHLLDFFGVGEVLQIIWGLIFRMRRLTPAEIAASQLVHPSGFVPYDLIRVDDNSLVSMISGGAVTTMHVIHVPSTGITIDTMVHELTHVAQYEHVGSVYMPQALHAQARFGRGGPGSAYDYEREGTLAAQRAAGKTFSDFNRESQAQLVQDYYNLYVGGGSTIDHQPFINDMINGDF